MDKDNTDYRNYRLRNGQMVGNVIHEQRSGLLNTWRKAQEDMPLGSGIEPSLPNGYVAGRVLSDFVTRAWSRGPIDFKNHFQGKSEKEADELARAGNFAYYAMGDGIIPRGLLDIGAKGYATGLALFGKKSWSEITPSLLDRRAHAVRDKALSVPDNMD